MPFRYPVPRVLRTLATSGTNPRWDLTTAGNTLIQSETVELPLSTKDLFTWTVVCDKAITGYLTMGSEGHARVASEFVRLMVDYSVGVTACLTPHVLGSADAPARPPVQLKDEVVQQVKQELEV
ncbi:hypothetical protein IAU60_001681 [Kwoniella sp. DSM 27419]